jgi:hypothetical protein
VIAAEIDPDSAERISAEAPKLGIASVKLEKPTVLDVM